MTEIAGQAAKTDKKTLTHVTTFERDTVEEEKRQHQLTSNIEKFDTTKLNKTETVEKNPLPDPETIKAEKTHNALLDGVTHVDSKSLKHVETQEKNPLPTKEDIELEKKA